MLTQVVVVFVLIGGSFQSNLTRQRSSIGIDWDDLNLSKSCKDGITLNTDELPKCENKFINDLKVRTIVHGDDEARMRMDACCSLKSIQKCYDIIKVISSFFR